MYLAAAIPFIPYRMPASEGKTLQICRGLEKEELIHLIRWAEERNMKVAWYSVIKYLQSLWGITILGLFSFETEFLLCALGSISRLTYLVLDTKKVI